MKRWQSGKGWQFPQQPCWPMATREEMDEGRLYYPGVGECVVWVRWVPENRKVQRWDSNWFAADVLATAPNAASAAQETPPGLEHALENLELVGDIDTPVHLLGYPVDQDFVWCDLMQARARGAFAAQSPGGSHTTLPRPHSTTFTCKAKAVSVLRME